MTVYKNTAESGLSSGTAVTTSNAAFTNGFDTVTPGTGSVTFSSAHVMKGSLAYAFAAGSASACFVQWSAVPSANGLTAVRFYVYLSSLPSAAAGLLEIRSSGGGTSLLTLTVGLDGKLNVISNVSASTVLTSTAAFSTGTWYRVELSLNNSGGTSAGAVVLKSYLGDSTTEISGGGGSTTTSNFGTSTIGTYKFGVTTASGTNGTIYMDDIAAQTTSTTLFGPSVTNTAPTSTAPADVTGGVVGVPVSITGTDSDSDGTVVTREWTCTSYPAGSTAPTLSGAATATVSFTPSATGIYVMSYRVQDDGSLWSTPSTMKVFVPGSTIRVYGITSPGAGALTGSDIVTAMSDASASTYWQTAVGTTNPDKIRFRLDPLKPCSALEFDPSWLLSASQVGTAKVRLYDGATLIQATTVSGGSVPTTSETTAAFTITSGNIATISTGGWLALDFEIEWGI